MAVQATLVIRKICSDNNKAKIFFAQVDTCLNSSEHMHDEQKSLPHPYHISTQISESQSSRENPS